MQIVTTKYGGFCFGVKRAVDHAMSMEGVRKLADYMRQFEKENG